MKKTDAGLYAVRRMQRLEALVDEMVEVLRNARTAIRYLADPKYKDDALPRTDIESVIDSAILKGLLKK